MNREILLTLTERLFLINMKGLSGLVCLKFRFIVNSVKFLCSFNEDGNLNNEYEALVRASLTEVSILINFN